MDYNSLSDDVLEQHLNPRVAAPDFQEHQDANAARSAQTRANLASELDIPYGESPLERLDIFPSAQPGSPVQVFIHGGYWRAMDKQDFSFVADALVPAGVTVVVINYDLCPNVTLDKIVEQTRRAIAWCHRHIADFGGDPERLFVSGHSAGAHLAIMALLEDWPGRHGLPADPIKGVTASSGVYELAPVLRISVNAEIRLTAAMAARNSPTLHPPQHHLPLLLVVGADEPAGWIKQTTDFRAAFEASAGPCEYLELPGRHHFSIIKDMADGGSPLFLAMLRQMSLL